MNNYELSFLKTLCQKRRLKLKGNYSIILTFIEELRAPREPYASLNGCSRADLPGRASPPSLSPALHPVRRPAISRDGNTAHFIAFCAGFENQVKTFICFYRKNFVIFV